MKKNFDILYLVLALIVLSGTANAQQKSSAPVYANTSLNNLISPTKIDVNLLPDKDAKRDLGSANKAWKNLYLDSAIYAGGTKFISMPVNNSIAIGFNALKKIGKSSYNTAIGNSALSLNSTGYANTALGFKALYSNNTGYGNVAIGFNALNKINDGYDIVAIGDSALYNGSYVYMSTAIGAKALFSSTNGEDNTATGSYALYSDISGGGNTANGALALYSNTTGYRNCALGITALYLNTTGVNNSAAGAEALRQNTIGKDNTAFGNAAMVDNTTGNYNTAGGSSSLDLNITGSENTVLGYQTLFFNTAGNSNVAVGTRALFYSASLSHLVAIGDSSLYNLNGGSGHCVAVGSQAGVSNTTGSNNTYIGYHAGNSITTGSSNTIIGYGADLSDGSFTNATAIGNLAVSGASNRVRVGNSSVTSIGGQVGWTSFSDERIKNNIQQNVPGLQFINLLKPVTYHFDINKQENISGRKDSTSFNDKYDIEKIPFTGFIAQEVEAAAKKIGYDFSGVDAPENDKDLYGLRYSDFVVPLVKAVQELSAKNDSLKNVNIDLENKFETQQKEIDELKAMIVSNQSTANRQPLTVNASASLQQNIPNPFSNSTTINYSLPQQYSSAKIIITDKNGNSLKQINITGNGQGNVNIEASTLSSGAYQYSLFVDGRLIATKQMMIAK